MRNPWPNCRGLPRGPAAVLSALHLAEPVAPCGLTDGDWRHALDYAYRATLALEFRRAVRDTAPEWVHEELDGAAARNRLRFERLRGLYSETRQRLEAAGIPYLALKGITHCPLTGTEPEARPQFDLDLYVPPAQALEARDVFLKAGYEPIEGMESFPTDHLPAMVRKTGFEWRGVFFDPELPYAVEIHVQFWNAELEGLPAPGIDEFWDRRETREVAGLAVPAMAPADALAYAGLHMLKHVLQGSLRAFHAYEVARLLEARREDDGWSEGHAPELRRLEAVAFRLAEAWFGCRMAAVAPLPAAAEVWFDEFALSPVTREFHANKDELWLHLSLVPNRADAWRVARRRLFPLRMPGPVDAVHIPAGQMTAGRRVLKQIRRARFAAGRVRYHAAVLPRVLWTGARWWWRSNALGSQFWIFLAAAVLFNFALFVFVLLYNLYLLDLGYRENFVGSLSGTATAGTVAGTLPAAWVLRRLGLRRSLLGVVAVLGGVMAMRAMARGAGPLLALGFLWGVVFAVWAVMISPMIKSVVEAERRPAAFSVFFAAMFTVGVVGNWTGGHLPHVLGGKRPALLAAAVMLAAALPAAWRLRPGKVEREQGRVYPRSPFLGRYLAANALWHLGTGAFNPFANVYFQRLRFPVERIGSLFSGTQILQVTTVLMAPAVIRRAGLVRAIVWMMAATAAGLGGLAAQPPRAAAMAAFGWYMSFQWMSEPGLNSLLMNHVEAREQSGASSLNYLVAFGAQAAAAFAAGEMMTRFGYGPVLAGAAAAAFRLLLGKGWLVKSLLLKETRMACKPEELRNIPLFALLDEDELAVLASQVEVRTFASRERIYKMGDPAPQAYVLISGKVRVSTVDEDHQEVVVDEPAVGDFFGFASMLQQTPHQTNAHALEESDCLEISRDDIATLLAQKPHAGMDLLTTLGRQFHAAQNLVRTRAGRNPNEVIEKETTPGEHIADSVARFGGSWTFIILFAVVLAVYTAINVGLQKKAWDPYPFILLNLFLSMLAAVQAPVIMMSQNRQDSKDRLRSELDFDVNRRAENEIQGLARKLSLLDDKIDNLGDLLRAAKPR